MSASDCDRFLWTLTPASGVGVVISVVMTPLVLTSDVRDWGPPVSPTTLVALLCLVSLARLLVRVPCSSGNTLSLDLTKLCGNPDLK